MAAAPQTPCLKIIHLGRFHCEGQSLGQKTSSAHLSATGGYAPPPQPKNCCFGPTPVDLGHDCIFSSIRNNQRLWTQLCASAHGAIGGKQVCRGSILTQNMFETTPACSALTRNVTGAEMGRLLDFRAYLEHLDLIWAQMVTKNKFQTP